MSRCSHCYEYGHNRRGCKSRRENLEARIANGCEWAERDLKKLNTPPARHCGFCHQEGHDRRKCESLVKGTTLISETIEHMRRFVVSAAEEHNFGVGSLVRASTGFYNDGDWVEEPQLAVVDHIDWYGIAPDNTRVVSVNYVGYDRKKILSFPFELVDFLSEGRENIAHYRLSDYPEMVSGSSCTAPGNVLRASSCRARAEETIRNQKWQRSDLKWNAKRWCDFIGKPLEEGEE